VKFAPVAATTYVCDFLLTAADDIRIYTVTAVASDGNAGSTSTNNSINVRIDDGVPTATNDDHNAYDNHNAYDDPNAYDDHTAYDDRGADPNESLAGSISTVPPEPAGTVDLYVNANGSAGPIECGIILANPTPSAMEFKCSLSGEGSDQLAVPAVVLVPSEGQESCRVTLAVLPEDAKPASCVVHFSCTAGEFAYRVNVVMRGSTTALTA
jgi:hypothetical protein